MKKRDLVIAYFILLSVCFVIAAAIAGVFKYILDLT